MTDILLIRHSTTEYVNNKLAGRVDAPLNEDGRKKAQELAVALSGQPIMAVYSSPLRRTLMTAQPIARQFELDLKPLDGIIDIDYGEWQGLSPDEAAARDGALYARWIEAPHAVKFPGGESLEEVRQRAALAVDDIVLRHPKETVALVSHKVVCHIIVLSLLGLDNSHFWQVTQDVCAVNLFEVRDGIPSALLINDTCHLRELN